MKLPLPFRLHRHVAAGLRLRAPRLSVQGLPHLRPLRQGERSLHRKFAIVMTANWMKTVSTLLTMNCHDAASSQPYTPSSTFFNIFFVYFLLYLVNICCPLATTSSSCFKKGTEVWLRHTQVTVPSCFISPTYQTRTYALSIHYTYYQF
jgi:hypothetical protein